MDESSKRRYEGTHHQYHSHFGNYPQGPALANPLHRLQLSSAHVSSDRQLNTSEDVKGKQPGSNILSTVREVTAQSAGSSGRSTEQIKSTMITFSNFSKILIHLIGASFQHI